jgi:uncharacterized membrane protein YuzA (DUF378 family)
MKAVHYIALLLVIVGAVNWGLVGAFDVNLVQILFGSVPAIARTVYVLVGLSGLVVAATAFGMDAARSTTPAGVRPAVR